MLASILYSYSLVEPNDGVEVGKEEEPWGKENDWDEKGGGEVEGKERKKEGMKER